VSWKIGEEQGRKIVNSFDLDIVRPYFDSMVIETWNKEPLIRFWVL
jgi:hypothetical protein